MLAEEKRPWNKIVPGIGEARPTPEMNILNWMNVLRD
jgi:hypothetical protein